VLYFYKQQENYTDGRLGGLVRSLDNFRGFYENIIPSMHLLSS